MSKFINWLRRIDSRNGYTCDHCGREVFCYPHFRLCERCISLLEENGARICPKCGRQTVSAGVCLTCKEYPPAFYVGCSALVYDGESAELVNSLKLGKRRTAYVLGEIAAKRLIELHRDLLGEEEWLIVPVPLTEQARKERGYNQTEEIVLAMLEILTQASVKFTLDFEVLEKRRETAAQKALLAQSRKENVSGAYHVHKRALCQGKNVLLVDDIMTTGATGDECAKLLKRAGASRVVFCCVAATPEIP